MEIFKGKTVLEASDKVNILTAVGGTISTFNVLFLGWAMTKTSLKNIMAVYCVCYNVFFAIGMIDLVKENNQGITNVYYFSFVLGLSLAASANYIGWVILGKLCPPECRCTVFFFAGAFASFFVSEVEYLMGYLYFTKFKVQGPYYIGWGCVMLLTLIVWSIARLKKFTL